MAWLRMARLRLDSAGSASLEAAMVFPVILLSTFLILFFALYVGQKAIVYYGASVAGERAAFNWSNSAKELRTGAYPEGSHDGLYWRMLDDGLLGSLFGTASSENGAESGDPAGESSADDSLTGRKLRTAADSMASSAEGSLIYENKYLVRRIRTEAVLPAVPEPLRAFRGTNVISAEPSAIVVEPAEFIRSFDLVRYYAEKMKSRGDGETSFRSKAKSVLLRRKTE